MSEFTNEIVGDLLEAAYAEGVKTAFVQAGYEEKLAEVHAMNFIKEAAEVAAAGKRVYTEAQKLREVAAAANAGRSPAAWAVETPTVKAKGTSKPKEKSKSKAKTTPAATTKPRGGAAAAAKPGGFMEFVGKHKVPLGIGAGAAGLAGLGIAAASRRGED